MPRVSKKQADEMDVEVRDGAATRARDARENCDSRVPIRSISIPRRNRAIPRARDARRARGEARRTTD
jgi:hypothetical protein